MKKLTVLWVIFSLISAPPLFAQEETTSQTITGELADVDEQHQHALEVRPFYEVTIRLTSPYFDTNLIVADAGDAVIASNDDMEGSLNSEVKFRTWENATYNLIVMSMGGDGAYEIDIQATPLEPVDYGEGIIRLATVAPQSFYFEGQKDEIITIFLEEASYLQPYLVLLISDETGQVLRSVSTRDNRAGKGVMNPLPLPASGYYAVTVTFPTIDDEGRPVQPELGDYHFRVERTQIHTISYGETMEGEITPQNQTVIYQFNGHKDHVVTVQVEGEIDTTLSLQYVSNNYELVYSEDDGNLFNPEIYRRKLFVDAEYLLIVRPQDTGKFGNFTLSLTR